MDESWLNGKKILEVGCADGNDFIRFFKNYHGVRITGIDIVDYDISQDNVEFKKVDAQNIPFEDKHFDLCVSLGALEHIEPIEKLCSVVSEIYRVSKSFIILVPSIATFLEPHTVDFLWQLKSAEKKRSHPLLNYFSDEAWLQFQGFKNAQVRRYSYIPFFVKNTIIYKLESS